MDSCIVCCQPSEDIFSRISTTSKEWKEWNVQRIIEKHLWWWYLKPPSVNNGAGQWLCSYCWQELSSFHFFFTKVEKEHKLLEATSICDGNTANGFLVEIKVEEQIFDCNVTAITKNTQALNDCTSASQNQLNQNVVSWNDREHNTTNDQKTATAELSVKSAMDKTSVNYFSEVPTADVNVLDWNDEMILSEQNFGEENLNTDIDPENLLVDPKNNEKISKFPKLKYNSKNAHNDRSTILPRSVLNVNVLNSNHMESSDEDLSLLNETQSDETRNDDFSTYVKNQDKFIADNHFVLTCNICNASQENFLKLVSHCREKHNTKGFAMCCNKRFYTRKLLIDHINVHNDPNYFQCQECKKALATQMSFDCHMKNCHSKTRNDEDCYSHGVNKRLLEDLKIKDKFIADNKFPLKCHICNAPQKNFGKLINHCRKKHNTKGFAMCCNKRFPTRQLLIDHINVHNDPDYFKCQECNRPLATLVSFESHMKIYHGFQKQSTIFPCDKCEETFKYKYILDRHMLNHETEEERTFSCSWCAKIFPSNDTLNLHISVKHSKIYEQTCKICGEELPSAFFLYLHLEKMHSQEHQGKQNQENLEDLPIIWVKSGKEGISVNETDENILNGDNVSSMDGQFFEDINEETNFSSSDSENDDFKNQEDFPITSGKRKIEDKAVNDIPKVIRLELDENLGNKPTGTFITKNNIMGENNKYSTATEELSINNKNVPRTALDSKMSDGIDSDEESSVNSDAEILEMDLKKNTKCQKPQSSTINKSMLPNNLSIIQPRIVEPANSVLTEGFSPRKQLLPTEEILQEQKNQPTTVAQIITKYSKSNQIKIMPVKAKSN